MKRKHLGLMIAMFAGLSLVSGAVAARDRPDLGQREYINKCAVCHGKSARGDGGVIDLLKRSPSDLTVLAKKNGGVFPFDRVYGVIDGRELVQSHGERDMPIWGKAYATEKSQAAEYYVDTPYDMESYTRARILALIDYLNRVQAK